MEDGIEDGMEDGIWAIYDRGPVVNVDHRSVDGGEHE